MKAKLALLAVSIALSSMAHATSTDYQKQIDDLKAGLHQTYVNVNTKYSESWGLEDRANIAKLQETKLDKSVFTADQARQDKALADAVTKQAATDSKQTSDLKSYADAKATSAYTTSVAHTDAKVARADADRKAGDDALSARIDGNAASQSERDASQDDHINAVQGAAQTANDRAGNLEVRADNIEHQAGVLDGRVGATEVRADKLEEGQRVQDAQMTSDRQQRVDADAALNTRVDSTNRNVSQNTSDIVALYGEASYSASRIDAANANIEANRAAIVSTNKKVADNTAQLADHERRLGSLEQSTTRAFADMNGKIDRVERKANAGTSAALASASIPQVTEYQRFALGAGVGGYESESALAVGFSSRVSSSVVIKASVTTDSQHGFGYGAGVSVGW